MIVAGSRLLQKPRTAAVPAPAWPAPAPLFPRVQVKPPICFTEEQADRMVDALGAVLTELTPQDKARLAQASSAEVEAVADRHRRLG